MNPDEIKQSDHVINLENADVADMRFILEQIIKALTPGGRASSRQRSLAVTKLEEARFWLGEDLYKN